MTHHGATEHHHATRCCLVLSHVVAVQQRPVSEEARPPAVLLLLLQLEAVDVEASTLLPLRLILLSYSPSLSILLTCLLPISIHSLLSELGRLALLSLLSLVRPSWYHYILPAHW